MLRQCDSWSNYGTRKGRKVKTNMLKEVDLSEGLNKFIMSKISFESTLLCRRRRNLTREGGDLKWYII